MNRRAMKAWCPVRDIIVLAIILGSVPVCLFSPYYGILVWTWIAFFNPHRFTWGIAYSFPVAEVIAVPTLLGTLFTGQRNRRILVSEVILMLMLWCWFAVTYQVATASAEFSHNAVAYGYPALVNVSKVLLMTMLVVCLVNTANKLRYLFLLTAFCFGALVIKGALFGLRTAGEQRVWGPPDSFVMDNNFLALATNMCLPIFHYMAAYEKNSKLRILMRVIFACAIVSVVLSYSRGGLLGLAVVLSAIAFRSRYKTLSIVLLLIAALLVVSFIPAKWMDRMNNFAHGKLDNSAERRLNAWEFAYVLARAHPLTGGGFETFTPALFAKYLPGKEFAGPHSCYFQVLGEHGFVGLAIYLGLLANCWVSLRRLQSMAGAIPELQWMMPYAKMLQVSLLGFMVTGAFLACAYFDLFFQLCAATGILKILARQRLVSLSLQTHQPAQAEPLNQLEGNWEPSAV